MSTQAFQSWSDYQGDHLNIMMFANGATISDGVTDATPAFVAAIAAAASFNAQLYLPSGTYDVTGLTIAVPVQIYGDGPNQTIIQYSGTASITAIVSVDGTVAGVPYANIPNLRIENLQLTGNGNVQNAIRIRNNSDSIFRNLGLRNCTGAAFLSYDLVVHNLFENIYVTFNNGFLFTQPPQYGFAAQGTFTANIIRNLRVEGVVDTGLLLGTGSSTDVAFNTVIGGLIDDCPNGVITKAECQSNVFIGMDVEVNTVTNYDISGYRNLLINCLSNDYNSPGGWLYIRGGYSNQVTGGQCGKFGIIAGSLNTLFSGVTYQIPAANYDPTVTYVIGQCAIDAGTGIVYMSLINGNLGNTPASSPLDWQANPRIHYDDGENTQWINVQNLNGATNVDVNRLTATAFGGEISSAPPSYVGSVFAALRLISTAWGTLQVMWSGLISNPQIFQYGCATGDQSFELQEITSGQSPYGPGRPTGTTVFQIFNQRVGLGAGVPAGIPLLYPTTQVQAAASLPTVLLVVATAAQSTTPLIELQNSSNTPMFYVDESGNLTTAGKLGCNGALPQAAAASGGPVSTTPSTASAPAGYTTLAQADGIVTLLNKIQAALVANGIMS